MWNELSSRARSPIFGPIIRRRGLPPERKIEEPDRPIELGHGLVAHDIQPCGAVVHSGVERESTILIVGQQAYVAKEVTRNVGTVEGDVALGANRRVEELDVERPICGRDVRRALRPGRRAQGAEKKG